MSAEERADDAAALAGGGSQRLDKWLWFARVVKSRTLAATLITAGKIRVNRVRAEKPSQLVKAGDVVTSSIKRTVRVLRVRAPGERRGPATEAALLFDDLTPPPLRHSEEVAEPGASGPGIRPAGAGRPTKRDRRSIDRLKGES